MQKTRTRYQRKEQIMETVAILKEYEKGSQAVRLVLDDDEFETIQIMDEMHINMGIGQIIR